MGKKTFQLDFFKDPEISRLEYELAAAKESQNKIRKSLFARHNKLQKQFDELKEEHELFKRNICMGKYDPVSEEDLF